MLLLSVLYKINLMVLAGFGMNPVNSDYLEIMTSKMIFNFKRIHPITITEEVKLYVKP